MAGNESDDKATIIATGATIMGNGGCGVSAEDGSYVDLDGASVIGNSGGGIQARGSHVTARGASIVGNGQGEKIVPENTRHPWYQRPVGYIPIGLFITIVGGVAVAYLISFL